jgi:hypothetical protein
MAIVLDGTTGEVFPSWTTAGRPASPAAGQTGYNSTTKLLETYNGTSWVSGGGVLWQSVQTTGFTAVAGNGYPVNTTSGAVTVTLPASASTGDTIYVLDYAGTFGTNYCTLGTNGLKINGSASNTTLATNRESVQLVYADSTQGWVVASSNTITVAQPYTISYAVIAGGGAGSANMSGGGAGGMVVGTQTVSPLTALTVVVGGGGSASVGSNSTLTGATTAVGGGYLNANPNGGSGCGGSDFVQTSGGSGTAGQGNPGGTGGGGPAAGGGPGGAGGAGGNRSGGTAGTTGVGLLYVPSQVTYAGGGGSGAQTTSQAGQAGGGNGATGAPGTAASANTGSGGGGAYSGNGANGGSGIVIISYVSTVAKGSGGNSQSYNATSGYYNHYFTSSGTFTP